VGKGETRRHLEQVVTELDLGKHVTFTGYRDTDLPAVLAAANCFALMAAGSDESCRAALEAMAAARPVIARRVGALPETVVHGETGFLIDDDRPESVAHALETILEDPERGAAMGRAGRARAEESFSAERSVETVGARVRRDLVRILQLVSCRGWSSDAYWAARTTRELERRGHTVTLACLPGKEARVLDGMHREGVEPVTTLAFASGVHPGADGRDLVRLRRLLERADVVHVHRGKEHWLAAVANRLIARPRPW